MTTPNYKTLIDARRDQYPISFDDSALAKAFIPHFNVGKRRRIKVQFHPSEKPVWGFVGVTTGWKPTFLLMRNIRCHGSRYVLDDSCKILDLKTHKE